MTSRFSATRLDLDFPDVLAWPEPAQLTRRRRNAIVFRDAVTPADAWRQIEEWLVFESVWIPLPAARHIEILADFLIFP